MENVIAFKRPPQEPQSAVKKPEKPDFIESGLPGLWMAAEVIKPEDIDTVGKIVENKMVSCGQDIVVVLSYQHALRSIKDFKDFTEASRTIILNIVNDVIFGSMGDLHSGFADATVEDAFIVLSEFVCQLKHTIALGNLPHEGSFVTQLSIDNTGLVVVFYYGDGQDVFSKSQAIILPLLNNP